MLERLAVRMISFAVAFQALALQQLAPRGKVNEQLRFSQRANLRPRWAEDGIGLGASQCDFAVGRVGSGANGWDLDKSDLHPGPDVLQRHRCDAKHDDGQWNEQLGVERRFG